MKRLSLIIFSLLIFIDFVFSCLKSPDLDLSFGNKITKAEIDEFESWYLDELTSGVDKFCDPNADYKTNFKTIWYDNRFERWAWQGSYMMSSLIQMWQLTQSHCYGENRKNDIRIGYFEELEGIIDHIWDMRENVRSFGGQKDYIAQDYINAWAQPVKKDNGNTVYVSNLIQTFMILEPIAELCHLILYTNNLNDYIGRNPVTNKNACRENTKTLEQKAIEWLNNILDTVDDFVYPYLTKSNDINNKWIGKNEDQGWIFRFPDTSRFEDLGKLFNNPDDKRNEPVAFNRMLQPSIVLAHLLTIQDKYLIKSSKTLYNNIKIRSTMYKKIINNVLDYWYDERENYGPNNKYMKWPYAGSYQTRVEDAGHGGIDVRAFIKLYKMGFNGDNGNSLTLNKLEKIAYSFVAKIYRGNGKLNANIDGTGGCSKDDTKKIGRYIALNEFCPSNVCGSNNKPWNRMNEYYDNQHGTDKVSDSMFGFTQYIYQRGGCHGSNNCDYPWEYRNTGYDNPKTNDITEQCCGCNPC